MVGSVRLSSVSQIAIAKSDYTYRSRTKLVWLDVPKHLPDINHIRLLSLQLVKVLVFARLVPVTGNISR